MIPPNKLKYKVAIIGAGPAGIACAIQLKRYRIDFVLFERDKRGGLLRNANCVKNYPGFPEGITGLKFVNLLCRHLTLNNIKILKENVKLVDFKNNEFKIKTEKRKYKTEILVIASGTKPLKLPIPLSTRVRSRVFYDMVDFKGFKNKTIAIIGSGDAAFDYAFSLSSKNEVLILSRSKQVKCLSVLFRKCIENRKIKYLSSIKISKIDFKDKRLLLYSFNKKPIYVDYLLVAIGRLASLDFLNDNIINKLKMLEHKKKLYMIGDVKNGVFRQIAIAVGDGVRSAMEIYFRLKSNNQSSRE